MHTTIPKVSMSEIKNYRFNFVFFEMIKNFFVMVVANNCVLMPLGISCVVAGNIMSETTKHQLVEHEKARNWLSLSSTVLNSAGYGVLAFWLGLIIVVGPSLDNDPNRMMVFFSTVILVYFATDLIKIILAKQLKRYLTQERIVLIKKGLGIVLIICGIVLISKGFLPKEKFDIKEGIERMS